MKLAKTHEKQGGGGSVETICMDENFRDALDEFGLIDLGFVGSKFTCFKNFANGVQYGRDLIV